jgi:hypothetical protein
MEVLAACCDEEICSPSSGWRRDWNDEHPFSGFLHALLVFAVPMPEFYRHIINESFSVTPALAPRPISGLPLVRDANYSVNPRALRKWSQERVRIERLRDGSLSVTFRFEGKTCSSQGRSLAFDYVVALSAPDSDYTILQADCRPAADDEGHVHMCAYLSDAASLMKAISSEKPLLDHPLNSVLRWDRAPACPDAIAVPRAVLTNGTC